MTTPSHHRSATRRAVLRWLSDDEAVSEVVGQILLVGITITTMVGLTVLVMSIDGPLNKTHADIEYQVLAGQGGWNTGDEAIRLTHQGGEPIERSSAKFRFIIDGVATEVQGSALLGNWTDGTLSINEQWQYTTTLAFGAKVEVLLINTRETTLTSSTVTTAGASAVGGQPVLTYVSAAIDNAGTTALLSNAQDPDDSEAEAILTEGAVTSTTQDRIGVKDSFSSVSNSGDDLLTSNNVRTRFNSNGDFVMIDGFTNPAGANSVQGVLIYAEGQRPADGGSDPILRVSYDVGGTAGATTADIGVSSIGSDALYGPVNVFGDRTWTTTDITDMRIRLERLSVNTNFAHADMDAFYIRVTYGLIGGSSLDVEFRFDAVPGGISHQVELEYRRANDDFDVRVWDGATWVKRGIVLNQGSATVWTYSLTNDEYNGGTVRIQFVDRTPGGASTGQLLLDYARIRSV